MQHHHLLEVGELVSSSQLQRFIEVPKKVRGKSTYFVLNLEMNSYQSILPSELESIRAINWSISRDEIPRFSFRRAFLNSTREIVPLPSSSNSLKMSSKLFGDVLMIYRSFSKMFVFH